MQASQNYFKAFAVLLNDALQFANLGLYSLLDKIPKFT